MPVAKIPKGYHTVTPYLVVNNVDDTIGFASKVLGAVEKERFADPSGAVMHAEIRIGDSVVMMGDARGGKLMPGMLHVYVDDVDRVYEQALAAGCKSIRAPEDQFYGDRSAGVEDTSGNQWWLATHIEDVSKEEMQRRHAAAFKT